MAKQRRSSAGGLLSLLRSGDMRAIFTRYSDLALAALVVVMVGMMIVPLPAWVLDLLISLNIAAAVVLLLVAIYVNEALRIATFPSLLLLTTLFRLALEVSATRLILLKANAGQVIHAFGGFVVAGNLVVGVVVFLILTTIQFVVIAKGAGRVAEVGARFTLDAMPGKQMSIDAELRAGHIDANEARRRRALLARESQFFGAMDGAMKFVKGDAVASIIVLVANIVGGLIIGVLMRGMDLTIALRTYTLLTIGEGLVAQIPALVISTAAGILVTRVSSEEEVGHLGSDIGQQILAQPKALAMAAALLFLLALVPGLPAVPFLILGALLGMIAYRLIRTGREPSKIAAIQGVRVSQSPLPIPIAIELSAELAKVIFPTRGQSRLESELLPALRDNFFKEAGIVLPTVGISIGTTALAPWDYAIQLHEMPMARGHAFINSSAKDAPLQDPAEIIARHLQRVLRQYGHMFVGIQETHRFLEDLRTTHPHLVREVVPHVVTPILLADILQRLAREGISLRPMDDILEALAKCAPGEPDAGRLTENVRRSLHRHITFKYSDPDGNVGVFFLDAVIEETVREALRKTSAGTHLALEPELSSDIVQAVKTTVADAPSPVIVTAGDIRPHLRRLLEHEQPLVAVLAHQELTPDAKLRTLGRITV